MANNLVQFRADEDVKLQATVICNQLGIDLQTYLRMCLSRLVSENGIPFSMTLDGTYNKGFNAMREAQSISGKNGNSDMTLEEINKEIDEARKNY
jgi:DNA-damage-inducible protein J